MKTTLLSTFALAITAMAGHAQSTLYASDFTTSPAALISAASSGSYTHGSDGTNWTIKANGTGEWDMFEYTFPKPLNLSGGHPTIKLSGVSCDTTALLTAILIDGAGHSADYYIEKPNPGFDFEIIKGAAATTYSYDFQYQFKDIHGSPTGGAQGITDSTNIVKVRFRVNPGWASQAHKSTITGNTYNKPLRGTIKIAKLEIIGKSVVGIETIIAFKNITLVPNPSNGVVNVNFESNATEAVNISVSNLLGQEVLHKTGIQSNINMDLSTQEKGIYFIRLESKQGVATKKIVIN